MTGLLNGNFIGKRCSLLKRRHDLSEEAFRSHWAGLHADIATTMPGIGRYTQNRVHKTLWWHAPHAAPYDCDGVVELEFKNEQCLSEANASATVRELLPQDEPRFIRGITLCQVPTGARQVWRNKLKVMLGLRLSEADESGLDALQPLIELLGPLSYSVEWVSHTVHRERLEYEHEPPHLFASLWFEERADLSVLFGERGKWAKQAAAVVDRGTAWLCDPLPIVG